ncbi:MAG TPA: helix-turn-helix transcriptional regulator [Gemmatimonadales bacterium]|nr:helix-turn-helix transcriptional regulator [Gemmatimonadales bacterium]
MLSEERRREIADFLKTRRMRRQPEELGLPRGRRRRTPGLRREEVATAAGVSAEWYTWLEQAREVRPSAQVLTRIGDALRLEPGETRHLLTLAGYAVPATSPDATRAVSVSLRLQRLIDQMEHGPAWVLGERWDIMAWNRAARIIHGDLAALQGLERNGLYQLFLGHGVRSMLVDWGTHAKSCVAKLRAAYASRVDDPWFNELVTLLRSRSADFERWWNANDIETFQEGVKHYEHPVVGRLVFDYSVLEVLDERLAALRLVAYVPAPGTGTREKMAALLGAAEPLLEQTLESVQGDLVK